MTVQLPETNNATLQQKVDSASTAGSSKPSIIDTIPLPMVLMLAAPYLAGKTKEDALKKAHAVYKESRFSSTIDILGEDASNETDCDRWVESYKQVIDMVAANQIPCHRFEERITVSFKPSMFSTVVPTEAKAPSDKRLVDAYHRIRRIVEHAKANNVNVTLEAEDARWADFHLDAYFSLLNEGYGNLGTVLQSRLFRTKDDLKRFDERARVRMVIGIYNEPAAIAYTEKPKMKEVLVDFAAELAARGTYLEIASHDVDCATNFINRVAVPQRVPSSKFELQMLLGVPRKEFQQSIVSGSYFKQLAETAAGKDMDYLADLARSGVIVRMYLPFGTDKVAGPYCKRRLKANPNMISYGIKNLFHLQ